MRNIFFISGKSSTNRVYRTFLNLGNSHLIYLQCKSTTLFILVVIVIARIFHFVIYNNAKIEISIESWKGYFLMETIFKKIIL